MKTKQKKIFDAVQMVRDIRDAMYEQATDPNFNKEKFSKIRRKWTRRLKQQMAKTKTGC